jgi:alkylated DNA repair dioxygenase AlkB
MTTYIEKFVEPENIFKSLWDELNWERRADAPRREYWINTLNRSYTYGRGVGVRTYFPQETHPLIEKCTDALEKHLGFRFEGCFLNGYESERDALGWHADDDPGIDHAFPIAVISLYGEPVNAGLRTIQTKNKETSEIESFILGDGSLFLMDAGMQDTHFHRIPKAGFKVRPRISLTYRKLVK